MYASRPLTAATLFQSTPPRGRRHIKVSRNKDDDVFQSTPPRGRRRVNNCFSRSSQNISIHASAREATIRTENDFLEHIYFNPRLREGGDFLLPRRSSRTSHFNPRLREGGDIPYHGAIQQPNYFNPRLREGGDIPYHGAIQQPNYFNPRLREGGDAWLIACLVST